MTDRREEPLWSSAETGVATLNRTGYSWFVPVSPKDMCCTSKPRCRRCPIRLLADGKLSPDDAKKIFAKGHNRKALKKAKLHIAA